MTVARIGDNFISQNQSHSFQCSPTLSFQNSYTDTLPLSLPLLTCASYSANTILMKLRASPPHSPLDPLVIITAENFMPPTWQSCEPLKRRAPHRSRELKWSIKEAISWNIISPFSPSSHPPFWSTPSAVAPIAVHRSPLPVTRFLCSLFIAHSWRRKHARFGNHFASALEKTPHHSPPLRNIVKLYWK